MRYFYDCEFLEGTQKRRFLGYELPSFLDTKNTIDLISIAIVSEEGREYYAISKDFNLEEAWNRYDLVKKKKFQTNYSEYTEKEYWIRENVLKPIYDYLCSKRTAYEKTYHWGLSEPFSYKSMKYLIDRYGKTNKQIAEEIKIFIGTKETIGNYEEVKHLLKPQFYGYYSAYDHVALCWLFGKMIDLPKGFPMYTIDLKQEVDNYIAKTWKEVEMSTWGHEGITLDKLKSHPNYPKQENAHNALADARWNKELYEFLQSL